MRAFIVLALFVGAQAGNIKIKPTIADKAEKVSSEGLKLRQKTNTAAATTSTMAQTEQLLPNIFVPNIQGALRNQAARAYFKSVYMLPTLQQKMQATEAFIQAASTYQMSVGRNPGTVERLTPNELEHWLTTEFLPEDFRDSGTGFGYLYPTNERMIPGLVSRGPEFGQAFKNRTKCITQMIDLTLERKELSLNYGKYCGNTNELGSDIGCDSANTRVMRVQNDDRVVCADSGTDACCAQHDLIRTGINLNMLATISSCKANNALGKCLASVKPNALFQDQRQIPEKYANEAAQCIYQVMPCLAQTKNRFYEIDFKTKGVPHVRSLYPRKGDHHVQVVFPFDHSYGEDMTEASTVYRKSMKADFDYSHWKHIDPPADLSPLIKPDTGVDQPLQKSMWDSLV